MLLGCIGDDFTGSSDIANTLAKGGMAVTQYNGVPTAPADAKTEAGVVSLKSRTGPVEQAVASSLEAAEWLLAQGCQQIFFKYCSTFDSTKEGNIGPVADALAKRLGLDTVIFCPAFPATGRSVYMGHLFVGDVPLHESSMKDHPLTPMIDSDLRRWLSHQTETPVKHLPLPIISQGAEMIHSALQELGHGFYIADAVDEQNLMDLGSALQESRFLTGGSGMALGLPQNFRKKGKLSNKRNPWTGSQGPGVILSGSCSVATRRQIEAYVKQAPSLAISPEDLLQETHTPTSVADWSLQQAKPALIYTSADPQCVKRAQEKYGQTFIADTIEQFFAKLATTLVSSGFKRIVTAGGETSGAVVTALRLKSMEIGPEIAPGVPALKDANSDLVLALKSGNFGDENFFDKALKALNA